MASVVWLPAARGASQENGERGVRESESEASGGRVSYLDTGRCDPVASKHALASDRDISRHPLESKLILASVTSFTGCFLPSDPTMTKSNYLSQRFDINANPTESFSAIVDSPCFGGALTTTREINTHRCVGSANPAFLLPFLQERAEGLVGFSDGLGELVGGGFLGGVSVVFVGVVAA